MPLPLHSALTSNAFPVDVQRHLHASTLFEVSAVIAEIAKALAANAVARDRVGGHAATERELLCDSGLLTLSVPTEYGGLGAPWPQIYQTIRELAKVDSALAHVFAFHHLQVAGVQLYGNKTQQRTLLTNTVTNRWFWGNALNPLDKRVIAHELADDLTAEAADGIYKINGIKSFSSGSVGSDLLTISAWHEASQSALIAAVPSNRSGIQINPDWDAFGQRQTDSGNVVFTDVILHKEDILLAPGAVATAQASVRSQVAQLIMANLYLGIGLGAFDEARRYSRDEARPWFASGVPSTVDDPYVQHRFGSLWLLLRPAIALADQAAEHLQRVWSKGETITAQDRGELAISVAEAKCLSHQAGLEVSNQMFDITGARSTSARYGYDRFWRNVRVHTLHDPIDYKLRDLGRYVLSGSLPEPTPYS
ncbi:acyl-CoA dehydrogenase family protein [Undibacterium sp. 5I1]|uniref:acyl-CoA dehydrogenase family protein n=1 Tax=unclassified Undibacterium TaxID=2630295 RepID=UPI002AB5D54B|nr:MULTISPECIES: acyl-CoA dehydrogenase family protein [unclassified Undibacterium]MDY7537462.1 acyl-CoA dehydrogenase family protein [Undibacterium sp. 5I1]MEB0230957.1 acyl-CoA dehydrogenase family protein [Undibacterium sp. 10I3]MEB0258204.1 acyl-CoA dehydrogenase family protein [Undibacterium sp. 5I1]